MFREPYEKVYKGVLKEKYDNVFNRSLEYSRLMQKKLESIQ